MLSMTQIAGASRLFHLQLFNSPISNEGETFWDSLCAGCRKQSVFEHTFRPLKKATAWDLAGPTQWKWNDELQNVIDEHVLRNRRHILRGRAWLGSIDCWMVGKHAAATLPTIVITNQDKDAAKRLRRLLQNDHYIRRSGFKLTLRTSCLQRTAGGMNVEGWHESRLPFDPPSKGALVSSYLGRRFTARSSFRLAPGLECEKWATFGGFVIVNGITYVLTVAHVFLEHHLQHDPSKSSNLEEHDSVLTFPENDTDDDDDEDSDAAINLSETDASDSLVEEDAVIRSEVMNNAICFSDHEHIAVANFRLKQSAGVTVCSDLRADWALVRPTKLPEFLVNRIVVGDRTLVISALGDFTQGMKLLVMNNDRDPVYATCSGTKSLISLPGSDAMQVAYAINYSSSSGESGSWVIDDTSGYFCGVVVAASPDGMSSYVISSRDIFASIAELHCTHHEISDVSLPQPEQPQDDRARVIGGHPDHERKSEEDITLDQALQTAAEGRMLEAEEMLLRALRGYEKAWGPEHTSTLSTVNNLGIVYADQGKITEAEGMYKRALRGYEKALGPEHSLTLDTVNNLGNLYVDQGKIVEAEEMLLRALRGYEKAWGPEHTSTLDTVNNLGNLYYDQGKIVEAEKLYMRALQGKERVWGPEHITTLRTVNNLGNLYSDQGKISKAKEMLLRALRGYEKAVGKDHPKTQIIARNLQRLYVLT